MKKLVSLLLAFAMLLSAVTVLGAEPASKVLPSTNIVNVTGNVEDGDSVNILLLDGTEVNYINEFPVESDGSYRAKFMYAGNIEGLSLQVKQGNEDKTDSVVSAISEKEAVSYELNIVNKDTTTVKAEIENYFNIAGKTYQIVAAYYDAEGKLVNATVVNEKNVENDVTTFDAEYVFPENAAKIKVFMWDSLKTMIPLVNELEGKKNNETIKVLAIGNSFTEDPCQYLEAIAKEEGVTLKVDKATIGGSRISNHWKAWQNKETAYKVYDASWNATSVDIDYFLDNNTYDIITFQQLSQWSGIYDSYIDDGADEALKYLREKQPDAEIVFQLTWAYEKNSDHSGFGKYDNDQEKMYNAIVDAVTKYCEHAATLTTDDGAPISLDGKPLRYIPTGIAFQNARKSEVFDTLNDMSKRTVVSGSSNFLDEKNYVSLHRDSYHASYGWGRYLAALTWYGALTGNSTLDVKYTPTSSSAGEITAEQRKILNKAANDAVKGTNLWN